MKNFNKILIISILLVLISIIPEVSAGVIEGLENSAGSIVNHSTNTIDASGSIVNNIESTGFSILTTIKYIISAVLILMIVYVGVQMILSMGSDEEDLSKAKKSLWYMGIGLIFINTPFLIYQLFNTHKGQLDGTINGTWSNNISETDHSTLINISNFQNTIGGIINFLETLIFAVAILMIIISGIKIMIARGREELITESKNKVVWSIVALMFVGFIEGWKSVVYSGSISNGADLFETMQNLALFFAGPVAILVLTIAGYYYITSNGDEERVKKAKTIIINVVIATIILLASFTFLKDLVTLKI